MQLMIPQIPVQKRGWVFTDKNYVYINFFYSPQYGGLNTKHVDYNERHIFMNDLLKDIYTEHTITVIDQIRIETHSFENGHYRILFMIENLVYWMRKNIDEMIGFNYYAYHFTKHGAEPRKLEISSIGNLINKQNHDLYSTFASCIDGLNRINEISNTYKHSFINSEAHDLIGKDEPVVNCVDLHWNNVANKPKWHSYFLREIVEDYVSFFTLSRETLKQFKLPDN